MGLNAQKIYDSKIEESKGPSFGLVGTSFAPDVNTEAQEIDVKSLYNSRKRIAHPLAYQRAPRIRQKRISNSVNPSEKADFNLSGINIPLPNGLNMETNSKPSERRAMRFPPPKVPNSGINAN
jgi:hypothetical protein